jgi:hypothetical protein
MKEMQIRKEETGNYSLWYIFEDGSEIMHKILHDVEAKGLVNSKKAIDTTNEIPYVRTSAPIAIGVANTQK